MGFGVLFMYFDEGKAMEALKDYFPNVNFTRFFVSSNGYKRAPTEKKLISCLKKPIPINGKYYLDIQKMVKKQEFKQLLPDPELFIDKLIELNNFRYNNSRKPLNIIKFYLMKMEKPFIKKLNPLLASDDEIPRRTLVKIFYLDFLNKGICQYDPGEHDNGKTNDMFKWNFSNTPFKHGGNSIYNAFERHSHKNCTLYLYGADFIKFEDNCISKFSDPSITAGDFVWYDYVKIKKELNFEIFLKECKKHLLEKLKIDNNLRVSLKDIYYSFCIPILKKNCYSVRTTKTDFIKCGNDIITNTLLRKRNEAGGQIQKFPGAWNWVIYYTLEGEEKGTNIHDPIEFETFIWRVARQKNSLPKIENRLVASEKVVTRRGKIGNEVNYTIKPKYEVLLPLQKADISYYFNKLWQNKSVFDETTQSELDDIQKNGTPHDKIEKVYNLTNEHANEKYLFSKKGQNTIKLLYWAAFPNAIPPDGGIHNVIGKDGHSGIIIQNSDIADELIKIEQKEEKDRNILKIIRENIKFIHDQFKDEFSDDNRWVNFIKNNYKDEESIVRLWEHLQLYERQKTSNGKIRIQNSADNIIFGEYRENSNAPRRNKYFIARMNKILLKLKDRVESGIFLELLYGLFKELFPGEKEWIQYIKKEYLIKENNSNKLLNYLQTYRYRSFERLVLEDDKFFLKEYLDTFDKNDKKDVNDDDLKIVYISFVEKMKVIIDKLDKESYLEEIKWN